MDCPRCHEPLPLVVDAESAPADRDAVEAHLALCEPCARRASLERALVGALATRDHSSPEAEPLPDGLADRVKEGLDREDAVTASHHRAAWRRGMGMALLAAALIAVGALAPALLSSAPPKPPAVMNPSQISGTLFCIECEVARRRPLAGLDSMLPRAAAPADPSTHGRLHLRDDAEQVWELLPMGGEAEGQAPPDISRLRRIHPLQPRHG